MNRKSKSCLQQVKKVEPKAVFLCSTSLSFDSSVLCVSGLWYQSERTHVQLFISGFSQVILMLWNIDFNVWLGTLQHFGLKRLIVLDEEMVNS